MAKTGKKTSSTRDNAVMAKRRVSSYAALKATPDGGTYNVYQTVVPIDELFGRCVTLSREHYTDGYQRGLDEKRVDAIAAHLNAGNPLPVPLLFSAQEISECAFNRATGKIRLSRAIGSLAVIDGQHRLHGFNRATARHDVPVSIIVGLTRSQEAQLFIDINGKQKGVSASLIVEVKALAERENERESELRMLYDQLTNDKRSPLKEWMSPTGNDPKKLSRVAFNRAFGPLLASDFFASTADDNRYKSIRNYLHAIVEEVGAERLIRATPLAAAVAVLPEVLTDAYERCGKNIEIDTLRVVLHPVAEVFADPNGLKGGKTAIQTRMHDAMVKERSVALIQALSTPTPDKDEATETPIAGDEAAE